MCLWNISRGPLDFLLRLFRLEQNLTEFNCCVAHLWAKYHNIQVILLLLLWYYSKASHKNMTRRLCNNVCLGWWKEFFWCQLFGWIDPRNSTHFLRKGTSEEELIPFLWHMASRRVNTRAKKFFWYYFWGFCKAFIEKNHLRRDGVEVFSSKRVTFQIQRGKVAWKRYETPRHLRPSL